MKNLLVACILVVSVFWNLSMQCYAAPKIDDNDSSSSSEEDEEYSLSGEAFEERTKRALAESCRKAETKDEDIEAFINEDPNPSYETKCLKACVLKKFEIMTADGKFNVKGTKELYELTAEDEDELKIRYDVIDSCKGVQDEDECELPGKIENCLAENAKKAGFDEW